MGILMKHVAAVLLLALAESEINEKNINATLASVGVKPNPAAIKLILAATKGKTPQQLIEMGIPKLSAACAVAAGAQPAAAAAPEKKDDKKGKKEEKKPVVEEDEDAGGFGDLFG